MLPTNTITSIMKSQIQKHLLQHIVHKWRDYRADLFFKTFINEIEKEYFSEQQKQTLDEALKKVLTTPEAEELLFEAYRRVCLSATKNLGPRIIALLTARLIIEERIATEEEESILILAEEMRDTEFMKFCTFFEQEKLEENLQRASYSYLVNTGNLGLHSSFRGSTSSHLSPVIALGKWAGKLERVGFLYTDTLSENSIRSGFNEQNIPVVAYHFPIVFEQALIKLYYYIRRAQGPEN